MIFVFDDGRTITYVYNLISSICKCRHGYVPIRANPNPTAILLQLLERSFDHEYNQIVYNRTLGFYHRSQSTRIGLISMTCGILLYSVAKPVRFYGHYWSSDLRHSRDRAFLIAKTLFES